ncbi:MAG: methyl-accepting chemotaxis protein [Bacteroidales bacterium]
MLHNYRINTKLTVGIVIGFLLGMGILVNFLISRSEKLLKEKSLQEVKVNANLMSLEIGHQFNIAMESARGLSRIFSGYSSINAQDRRRVFSQIVRNTLEGNPQFLCVWAVFEPNAIDGFDDRYVNASGSTSKGRFCPSFYRAEDGRIEEETTVIDDAELMTEDYVSIPTARKKETLLEPYFYSYSEGGADSIFETTVAIPVIINNKLIGIAGIDFKLSNFQAFVKAIKPYETGFAVLISNEGSIVYHPDSTLIGRHISDQSFGGKETQEKIGGGENFISAIVTEDKEHYSYFFNPLNLGESGTPWSLAVVVPDNKILEPVKKMRNDALKISALLITGILVIMLLVTYAINSALHKVRTEIEQAAENILGGKLDISYDTQHVNVEFRPIIVSMSGITENIRTIIEHIRTVSATIHSTTQQFIEASEEMNSTASRLTDATESFSGAMNEMIENIRKNVGNAKETEKISLKAAKSIALTNIKLKESQDAMHNIAGKIGIISDISFQTNILALNAAVEAARAGDAGRGFTVVAGEVKKLADRSKLAAEEIISLMKYAVENSDSAMKRMDCLVPEIDRTGKLVFDITAKSEEQNGEAAQADEALKKLNIESQGHTLLISRITEISQQLENEALALEEMVSKYKT